MFVFVVSSANECGASGASAISAPLPSGDSADVPTAFDTVIFANTAAVSAKLKGAAVDRPAILTNLQTTY